MPPGINRKLKIRDGHRAAVKKLVGKANDNLNSLTNEYFDEVYDILSHIKESLHEKSEILTTLNKEILNSIQEDDIVEEIELCDEFSEIIKLTVRRIESNISKDNKIKPDENVSNEVNPDTNSLPISQAPAAPHIETLQPAPNSPESDMNSQLATPNHPTRTSRPYIRLPKLELKKFDGEYSKWQTFWDSFQSSIHDNNDSLTLIDKFNYLLSLVEKTAADAISGLSLTAANYKEAISILQHRFGNKQNTISSHMETLLNIEPVTSNHNTRGLGQLYDTVESNVRGLKALGVTSETYGSLLSSVLMNKLPHEMRLVVSRETKEDQWRLDQLLEVFCDELEARERARSISTRSSQQPQPFNQNKKYSYYHKGSGPATATALYTQESSQGPTCTYCRNSHPSASCNTVSNIDARKDIIRKFGRCYICLRKGHRSRDCPTNMRCTNCENRHHVSICPVNSSDKGRLSQRQHGNSPRYSYNQPQNPRTQDESKSTTQSTNSNDSSVTMYSSSSSCPVLLQTARTFIYRYGQPRNGVFARMIFDNGSRRTYITERSSNALNLPVIGKQTIKVKTFGTSEELIRTVDVLEFCVKIEDATEMKITAYVVPHICDALENQYVAQTHRTYPHLSRLWLADYTFGGDCLPIDILIGSDQYWNLVTGRTERGEGGPVAIHTKVGWVLSGPTMGTGMDAKNTSNNLITTHVLKCSSQITKAEDSLTSKLNQFWDLESIGINSKSVYEEFLEKINYNGRYYEASLPWKATHPPLPDNYDLSLKRLKNLLKRLQREPNTLLEYDNVIKDQLKRGIVELVETDKKDDPPNGNIHYIPHHAVMRREKTTTKLRIVYDASARSNGPSLNDCVHAGPTLTQKIMDIIIRFRSYKIALTGDIEKAFLMVRIAKEDTDVLRFLWVDNIEKQNIITLRFTRAVFGVTSSPFLLNATIKHHMEKYEEDDEEFVNHFLKSIYVDDVTSGADTPEEAYEFYVKSKLRLSEAGFNLRKFLTNSRDLFQRITQNEEMSNENSKFDSPNLITEEDETFSRTSLGIQSSDMISSTEQKILGIRWDYKLDEFIFDLTDIFQEAKSIEPTKRSVISIASKFYDPLGFISPIIVQFKLLFQELCKDQRDWDTPLDGDCLRKWNTLIQGLNGMKPIHLPRCYLSENAVVTYQLIGFCDASLVAYGAVVYLKITTANGIFTKFIASKTRVSPINKQTIPRLELLSALVLSRLLTSIKLALEPVMTLLNPVCYSDSKVALYWITQPSREWKQFVQNRVDEIRTLIPDSENCWRHCPGPENPADILTRPIDPDELASTSLWWNGPTWLTHPLEDVKPLITDDYIELEDECLNEMKVGQRRQIEENTVNLIVEKNDPRISNLIDCTEFSDKKRLLRITAYILKFIELLKSKNPQHLTKELTPKDISNAESLWIKEVQRNLNSTEDYNRLCHRLELFEDETGILRCGGRLQNSNLAYSSKHSIILEKSHWFTTLITRSCHRRVQHGGVKDTLTEVRSKYWIIRGRQFVRQLIYSCTTCRRFAAKPYSYPDAPPLPEFRVTESRAFSSIGLDYLGPLYTKSTSGDSPKAPWWGGFFERLVRSIKEALKKTLGQARLSYDELLTTILEIGMMLNSRPISYVTSDDYDEPLTPSHLICGHRIASLPDRMPPDDIDFMSTPDTLTKRMKHIKLVMDQFWNRWRKEYLIELRNSHIDSRGKKPNETKIIYEGEMVLVHDADHPRSFWKLGRVIELVSGADDKVRGAIVRICNKNRNPSLLQRPLKLLYPLEINLPPDVEPDKPQEAVEPDPKRRPTRLAATAGEKLRRQWILELKKTN